MFWIFAVIVLVAPMGYLAHLRKRQALRAKRIENIKQIDREIQSILTGERDKILARIRKVGVFQGDLNPDGSIHNYQMK